MKVRLLPSAFSRLFAIDGPGLRSLGRFFFCNDVRDVGVQPTVAIAQQLRRAHCMKRAQHSDLYCGDLSDLAAPSEGNGIVAIRAISFIELVLRVGPVESRRLRRYRRSIRSVGCRSILEPGTLTAGDAALAPQMNEAVVRVLFLVVLLFASLPVAEVSAQTSRGLRRTDSCRCEPGKPRRPRVMLPIAGGIGFLPVALAVRDSQLPSLDFPSFVDIRDTSPRNALEGERALEVGALAPDTATTLPTLMAAATALLLFGLSLVLPRRRRRPYAGSRRSTARRGRWRLRSVHRRRLGVGVAATGGLLLLLGSREYAEGAQAQRRARAEWLRAGASFVRVNPDPDAGGDPAAHVKGVATRETADVAGMTVSVARTQTLAQSAVPLPALAVSGREIRRGAPVARLVIPSIEVDEIVMEGVGPVELNGGPGHFPGSVLPGEAGNAVISAHRDRHFRRMDELIEGTKIRTETRTGVVEWVVAERRVVSRDAPALFQESEATLTLTTCWPIRYFGSAPDRLIIVAKRLR